LTGKWILEGVVEPNGISPFGIAPHLLVVGGWGEVVTAVASCII